MKKLVTYIITLLFLVPQISNSQTKEEVEIISIINSVRTNPKSFIPYIEQYLNNPFTMLPEKKMGEELILVLKKLKPTNGLIFDKEMYSISCDWSTHLKSVNKIEHGNFGDRFKKYGTSGENLAGGSCLSKPLNIVILTLMEKGHRENLLDTRWSYVSVSTNDFVCVQNFR